MRLFENDKLNAFDIRMPLGVLPFKDDDTLVGEFLKRFETDQHLTSLDLRSYPKDRKGKFMEKLLCFGLPRDHFVAEVIQTGLSTPDTYEWRRDGLFPAEDKCLEVIVEFSSPNVAKPFHMGHLRSTIVGNFVANIHEAVGHKVRRINFLGDWGTQFGLLAAGLQDQRIDLNDILASGQPMDRLYQVYVEANKKAEQDEEFALEAKRLFAKLEDGEADLRSQWRDIREATIKALEAVYARLGIHFDHYHGESMYGDDLTRQNTLRVLKENKLLTLMEDGRQVIDLDANTRVIVTKSDGSSLYITRDIAAALHRIESMKPDKMLYVVDQGQAVHFSNLFRILERLGWPVSGQVLGHIQFGKILGMSTRKGTAVFLSDILDEAKERMGQRMDESPNTRVEAQDKEAVADVLGITAVAINDLKHKRNRAYDFSWEAALKADGDSGIKLQYTHSRLTSLIEKNPGLQLKQVNTSGLQEKEAMDLILRLAQFDEALMLSYVHMEPSMLVSYLMRLCNDTSKAFKVLHVKGCGDEDVASARLALFTLARKTLRRGMTTLGLTLLHKM